MVVIAATSSVVDVFLLRPQPPHPALWPPPPFGSCPSLENPWPGFCVASANTSGRRCFFKPPFSHGGLLDGANRKFERKDVFFFFFFRQRPAARQQIMNHRFACVISGRESLVTTISNDGSANKSNPGEDSLLESCLLPSGGGKRMRVFSLGSK